MNPDGLSRQIAHMRTQLTALRSSLGETDSCEEAIEALSVTLEELLVAEEDVRRQNQELLASRAALDEERKRYRDLFEFAPDGYLVTDLFGLILDANRSAAGMLNIDLTFLVGKPIATFVPQEDRPGFRTTLLELRTSFQSRRFEARVRARRGSLRHVVFTVSPMNDQAGRPSSMRWAMHDATALKRAEEELQELNASLERRVVERTAELESELRARETLLIDTHAAYAAPDPVGQQFLDLVHDLDAIIWKAGVADGRYTFVSRRAEVTLGYPVERWLEEPRFWSERVHPEDRDWAVRNRERFAREGRDHEAEYRMVAADGRSVWFRESVRVLKDDAGAPSEMRGLMVNITKRKKIERQLYSAKNELSDRLEDMVYLLELNGRLSASLDLQPILNEVLTGVVAVFGAEHAMLWLHDPPRQELKLVCGVNVEEMPTAGLLRVPEGENLLGQCFRERKTLMVEDTEAVHEDPSLLRISRSMHIRAVFCTPLLSRDGRAVGTIAATFRQPHRPSERQTRLVERFARQAADFIENAREHESLLEEKRRTESIISDVDRELRPPLEMLRASLQQLQRSPFRADSPTLETISRQVELLTEKLDNLPAHNRTEQNRTG